MIAVTHATCRKLVELLVGRVSVLVLASFAFSLPAHAHEITTDNDAAPGPAAHVLLSRAFTDNAWLDTSALSTPAGDLSAGDLSADADSASDFTTDASLGGEAQPQNFIDDRDIVREMQDSLGLCIRGSNNECRNRIGSLFGRMKAQGITVQWSSLEPVRNNMYFYLVAPSLRLATAILKARGGCGEWQTLAAKAGMSLLALLRDAQQEVDHTKPVPGLTALFERKELKVVQDGFSGCRSAGGDD